MKPDDDWISVHRRQWACKPGLRAVYARYFDRLRDACAPGDPVVEIGCGPGFFKERYPEIIATDVGTNPYADRAVDAAALPFTAGEVANVVMLDVFHHLPDPVRFLRETARVLRPGGHLVMIEPWLGLAGRVVYRWLHHEDCDATVSPERPWSGGAKDPMSGNAALPDLFFRRGGQLERLGIPLRVVRREPFTALPWLLSGGFQPITLLPRALLAGMESLDRVLSQAPALTATRCFLVIERTGGCRGEA
jgi:SAM-dependent methyltransferase